MGLIPFRVLNDCIHQRDYTLICDCEKPATFVGVFIVGNPDRPEWSKEALFLCTDCAALVDEGVELHSLHNKAVRAEIDDFAKTRRADATRERVVRQAMAPEERRRRQNERRREIRRANPEAYRERHRRYHETYWANRTPEQIEAKKERDRIRYRQRKAEQQQGAGND